MEAFTIKAYTVDATQIEIVKAFLKALKIKLEVAKPTISAKKIQVAEEKVLLITEIKEAIHELDLIKRGKLKGIPA